MTRRVPFSALAFYTNFDVSAVQVHCGTKGRGDPQDKIPYKTSINRFPFFVIVSRYCTKNSQMQQEPGVPMSTRNGHWHAVDAPVQPCRPCLRATVTNLGLVRDLLQREDSNQRGEPSSHDVVIVAPSKWLGAPVHCIVWLLVD